MTTQRGLMTQSSEAAHSSRRKIDRGLVLVLSLLLGAGSTSCALETSEASNDTTDSRSTDAYEVVHGWPAVPSGYRIGEGAGIAVNTHDQVVFFHRADVGRIQYEGLIHHSTILILDNATGEIVNELGAGLFRNPHGLDVDSEDNIWVTDNSLHQVFKLSPDGEVLLTVGEAGVRGDDETHLSGPTDVAAAADGSFYVTDGYGNSRVVHFDAEGNFIRAWGEAGDGPSQFATPHGITLDADGNVYVADRGNVRIQVFDSEGNYLKEWSGDQIGRPWGVEIGADGSLYVGDGGDYWLTRQYDSMDPSLPRDRSRIHRMDLDGNVLETWGDYGRYDGQMMWLHDVAVAPDGSVFAVDIRGQRIQKFSR